MGPIKLLVVALSVVGVAVPFVVRKIEKAKERRRQYEKLTAENEKAEHKIWEAAQAIYNEQQTTKRNTATYKIAEAIKKATGQAGEE